MILLVVTMGGRKPAPKPRAPTSKFNSLKHSDDFKVPSIPGRVGVKNAAHRSLDDEQEISKREENASLVREVIEAECRPVAGSMAISDKSTKPIAYEGEFNPLPLILGAAGLVFALVFLLLRFDEMLRLTAPRNNKTLASDAVRGRH